MPSGNSVLEAAGVSGGGVIVHPQFDPVAFSIGPVAVHWYGLMYLVAFGLFWFLGVRRTKQPHIAKAGWVAKDIEDLLFYGVIGVVIGGRLGYVFFYKLSDFMQNPVEVFSVWKGGMSFHGGFLGVLVVVSLYAYIKKRNWLDIADLVAPCIPIGLAAGRIGNFINGELWGRVTDSTLPWMMVFPQSHSMLPRHPSQLYQALLEGVLLFVVLWVYAKKPRVRGSVSALFLIGYGVLRFIVEFFREPDDFLGLRALDLSQGQWLCVPMVIGGILLYVISQKMYTCPREEG